MSARKDDSVLASPRSAYAKRLARQQIRQNALKDATHKAPPQEYSPTKTAKQLWALAEGQRWRFVVALIATLVCVVVSSLIPFYTSHIIDNLWVLIQKAHAEGHTYVFSFEDGGLDFYLFIALTLVAVASYFVQQLVMASFAERFTLALRKKVARKLEKLPLAYYDVHTTGEIMSVATNDIENIVAILQFAPIKIITAVITLIGAVGIMMYIKFTLALFFLACLIACSVVIAILSSYTRRRAAMRQEAYADFTSKVEEAYSGRSVTEAFNCDEESLAEMEKISLELAKTHASVEFVVRATSPIIRFLNRATLVIVALFAGRMLLANELSVGEFQACFLYIQSGGGLIINAAYNLSAMQGVFASTQHVFELLEAREAESSETDSLPMVQPARGKTVFDHVAFSYTPAKPFIKDISFEAMPGQKIAVVGSTGSGKSTLINLLLRFYEIDSGRIAFDDVNTRHVKAQELRRTFGVVPQDTWLFEGTIAENIAYGCPEASQEDIVAAAKAARADSFIQALPEGYDTYIKGEDGFISQGQRQLLTIARAILCNPTVLIFDEATSSVDTNTEHAINEAAQELMSRCTSFVIAHRLSTILDADLILVMDHGDIVERGTHKELLATNGYYASLYKSQFA